MGAGWRGGSTKGCREQPGHHIPWQEGSADGCLPSNLASRHKHPLYLLTSHLLLPALWGRCWHRPWEARKCPWLLTTGQADSMLHWQQGEEGPDPGPPPCSTLPKWVLQPAPLCPAQLPTYLAEPQGEEDGSKPKGEPGDGRAVGRMQLSVPGVAGATALSGLAVRVSGATRLPTAPLSCSPLFPRRTLAPSAHPTVQP